jgi:hypothetical protein
MEVEDVTKEDLTALLNLYYDDPALFAKQVLNIELDEQQIYVINTLYNGKKKTTVRAGVGVGKTTASAVLIWHFLITRYDSNVFITAPGAGQISGALWPKVSELYYKMHPFFKKDWNLLDKKIVNVERRNWFCIARTARRENPEAMQGAHNENMLYIIDEASGVDDDIFNVIRRTMTQDNNYIFLIGNPDRISGFFFESHQPKFAEIYDQLHMSAFKSKFVSVESIKEKKIEYGENDSRYRVSVLGEFPTNETDAIILAEWVRDAMARTVDKTEGEIYWGIDIGSTTDPSILIKRKGNKVYKDIKEWRERDTMKLVGRIVNEYNNSPDFLKPTAIFVDAIALGKGPFDRLKELKLPVVAAIASNKAKNKKYYLNAKTEWWFAMKDWFRNEQPDIPNDIELAEQLYTMQSDFHSSGRHMVEEKFQYRRRMNGKSSDKADALAMTFAQKKSVKPSESLFFI